MTTRVRVYSKSELGSKSKTAQVEVGKWFNFHPFFQGMECYGKVVSIEDEDENGYVYVNVEKYFELPSYRPYAAKKWFDSLPMAVANK